jgi:translation initiation factor 4E
MSTTALPPQSSSVVDETLNKAMKEASIKSSPSPSEPKSLSPSLEDGEIREVDGDDSEDNEDGGDAEEDDGRVKTVFDDARKFNVKVSSQNG